MADRLLKSGLAAVARPVAQISSLQPYQAVVLGSAIHEQAWLPEAADFLSRHQDELAKLPVWLFSACSSSDRSSAFEPNGRAMMIARAGHECSAVADARKSIHFRDHRHFSGAFERGSWSLLGDLFLKVCGGSAADHRDWRDINEWAAGIARKLQCIDRVKERRRLHLSVRGRP